ncbi:MAG: patatin-like phospholipase family protein [Endomicrobia bacterium]|nr:patatin-like phospholipase family protein [Endomicrobiia bacterium]MCL2507500.1 patatin-like phospholipase family protein [Endomicrobiia bacterium]
MIRTNRLFINHLDFLTLKSIIILISVFFLCIQTSFASSVFDFDEEEFTINSMWNRVLELPKEKAPKIALVLGGGGARGFSHIGVFNVLQAEQVPVDLVVGTSIGSIVGAFYCAGMPMSKAEELAKNFTWKSVSDISATSMLSMLFTENLLSNEKIETFLNENIGDLRFDQLQIPMVCVATDLNTGERVLLRDGSVSFAARASATLPGIFKPVEYRQRYLVDGGLSENVPVNIAKLFDPDIIIAVAVSADISKNSTDNVFETLMQSIYIQGKALDGENLRQADIIIRPEVGEISAIDMAGAYGTIEKGFIAAKKAVKQIKIAIINKTLEKYLIE